MTATLLKPGGLSQHVPNLSQDAVRTPQDVSGCEAEKPDPGHEEAVLAAVVVDQAGAMCFAVAFNAQALLAVIEVWAPQGRALFVANGDLQLRTGQPAEHEQHSQARFHWRFSLGIGELQDAARSSHAFASCLIVDPAAKLVASDKTRMERLVGDHN